MLTAEQLKASILQEAIQGKLVPQLDEEPAVEVDAADLVEGPFAIPKKWKWLTIGKIFTLQAGKFISASEIHAEGPYPCFGGNGIRGYVEKYNRKGTYPLIGRQGALCGNINMASGCFYATEHAVVVDCNDVGDPKCVGYFLTAMNLNQYATATAQPGLAVKKINRLLFPLPPLAEQKRIVAKLNELLPLVEQYGQAQSALETMERTLPDKLRAAVLQEAIQGKLVPQLDDEEPAVEVDAADLVEGPFAIPEKWKWVYLPYCTDINPKVEADDDTDVSFIPMPFLHAGYVNKIDTYQIKRWVDVKKGFTRFEDGDIILAKITPCFQNRKSAIVKNLKNGIGAGTTELHVFRCNYFVIPEYILLLFKTKYFIDFGIQHFKGTAGQQRIGTADLKMCAIPLPPLAEQKRIVARLNVILPHIEKMASITG